MCSPDLLQIHLVLPAWNSWDRFFSGLEEEGGGRREDEDDEGDDDDDDDIHNDDMSSEWTDKWINEEVNK